jgi:hypothetical protein
MSSNKAKREEQKKIVEDRTFGLKNKAKSKVVQQQIKAISSSIKGKSDALHEKLVAEKKAAKLMKMQADEELRALFNQALDDPKGKKAEKSKQAKQKDQAAALKKEDADKQKLMTDYPFIADEMLAATGMLSELTPEEMSQELAVFLKTGVSGKLTLEQVIELQRAKMRSEGKSGTPVTEATLAKWKSDRVERRRLAAVAKVEAELRKKKGGKGLSVLSGKELFAYDHSLFVDDAGADDDKYERTSDADEDEFVDAAGAAAEDGAAAGGGGGGLYDDDIGDLDDLDDDDEGLDDEGDDDDDEEDASDSGTALRPKVHKSVIRLTGAVQNDAKCSFGAQGGAAEEAVAAVAVSAESLYLDGSDDDLDDLDDD